MHQPKTIGIQFSLSHQTARAIARARAAERAERGELPISDDPEPPPGPDVRFLVVVTPTLWSTRVFTEAEDWFGEMAWQPCTSSSVQCAGIDFDADMIVALALQHLVDHSWPMLSASWPHSNANAIKFVLGAV
jgi:hypothetical protein